MPASSRPSSAAAKTRPDLPAPPAPPAARAETGPERWSVAAGDAAQARLRIPADAQRERRFEIAVAMTVRLPADGNPARAWHQLTVHADGRQQWQRRAPTHNPGEFDGLDVRFRQTVPVGRELVITAAVATEGARRRSLDIEAEES
jgi:hypothetical protein